ncbi:response regulator [Azotosporobacter soli]|uniref:response regulator n=1 Tax=Azotosporobacter soli TaxID=3055040 RepID=UPI0031FEA004
MNILLIDDDRDCLESLAAVIEPAGHSCDIYTVPEEAVAAYDGVKHQAVITDIKMPGLSGIQVLRLIKAKNGKAKVLLMTGYGDVDTAIAAVNYGAYYFFSKPVNIDEIIEVLERIARE